MMGLHRHTPLKRTEFKRKPSRSKGEFPPQVREMIALRSGGQCEANGPLCRGRAVHIHHILRRSQGGKGTVSNGLHVCTPCHTWIHDHPAESVERGWLARSGGVS
jgi:hypothetical protein